MNRLLLGLALVEVRLGVLREGIAALILKAPEWIGATPRMTGSTKARMLVVVSR